MQNLEQQELERQWMQKIAEQKRELNKLGKNQLIRVIVQMSLKAYDRELKIQTLEEKLNENSYVPNLDDIAEQQSTSSGDDNSNAE